MIPTFTEEERAAARDKAMAHRRRRSELKASLKAGEVTFSDVLVLAETDEAVASMLVVDVLRALPGMGERRTEVLMKQVRLHPRRRVRGLGPRQREALVNHFEGGEE